MKDIKFMRKIVFLSVCILYAGVGLVQAQSRSISGKALYAKSGKPVAGASIVIKGASTGVVSDVDGGFTISVPASSTVLQISYIGVRTAEVEAVDNMTVRLYTSSFAAGQFSVYTFIGLPGLKYRLEGGTQSAEIGVGNGIGYSVQIGKSWRIETAVEYAIYGNKVSYDAFSEEYEEKMDDYLMKFSYSLKNYKETQSLILFSVPVMLQYGLPLGRGGSMKFFVSGGFKFGFPVSATADITPGTVTTSGYYSYEGVNYGNLPQHGFVNDLVLPNTKKDIEVRFSTALALETGLYFTLTDKIGLYTGLYLDYGLNSIQKVNDRRLLEYDAANESTFKYNSVLNTGLTDKVNLFATGLKVRISFNL
jgi:hypothetical protein